MTVKGIYGWLFDPEYGSREHFVARWLWLRALGLIYFSAFYALLFQVLGLIGSQGILPAADYLDAVRKLGGMERFWYAPTLLWLSSSDHLLMGLMWAGVVASVLLVVNVWPRMMLVVCFVCFLSFVAAAQDFSGYQSDGMLLEAGFLSLFLGPGGVRPGLGVMRRPVRAAMLLLLWEWFRIYFQSGVVKLRSGDPTWRNLTAMYEYYQNGPLPTWVGWYLQHLPNWFHVATAAATLVMELGLVWMAFLGRRWRIVCFFIVTAWQIAVILTANYTFLNYLVLALAVLLLDDAFLQQFVPRRRRAELKRRCEGKRTADPSTPSATADSAQDDTSIYQHAGLRFWPRVRTAGVALVLTWIFYVTLVPTVFLFWREAPLATRPVAALEPFRIANQYGLFAVMTPHRYEIEFQGSNDGENWVAYPFRYKPQEVDEYPRIYAPYQPRFDWNLWFASLGPWRENLMVPRTEEMLLENDRAVLGLFRGNPFPERPPRFVRAVLWQYWFSSMDERRREGIWWRRQLIGDYAPTLTKVPDGYAVVAPATGVPGP